MTPDWLQGLDEEDPDCKEGFYIGLPPNADELCEDEEEGVRWSAEFRDPRLLELIAYGPPPDVTQVGLWQSMTSYPSARFYVARTVDGKVRAGAVMDKLVSAVFSNVRHVLKLPMTRKYVEAWLRGYHPLLSFVLNGQRNPAADEVALVWTRPDWARRTHWVLTLQLDGPDADFTPPRAVEIVREPRFRRLRNAHRNLLIEDAQYFTVGGQLQGAGRLALEGLDAAISRFTQERLQDALGALLDEYEPAQGTSGGRAAPTSFRKPEVFRRFERG